MPVIETIDDLLKLKVQMETLFTDLHKEIRTDEDYYDLDFKKDLQLPEEYAEEGVVLPTARSNVDLAVDHVDVTHRRVEVPARDSSTKAQSDARQKQRFYESLLNFVEGEHDQSPFRQGVKRLGEIGVETWKFMPIVGRGRPKKTASESDEAYAERLEQWKIEHASTMPFRLIPVHPSEMFFDPWNPSPKWAIHAKKMLVGEVEELYPDWENRKGKKLWQEVDVVEWWDATHRAVAVNGENALPGEVARHRWGTHPWIIGASGYGVEDSEHRLERKYVSINRYLRDVLHSESRNYSVNDVVLKQQAWPVRVAVGDRANEVGDLELSYGKLHRFPAGVEIKDLNASLPPDAVARHMSLAKSLLIDATGGAAARGGRAPGTTSGIDQQTQLSVNRLKFRPIAIGIERMLKQVCEKAGIYMRTVINHPVSIAPGARTDEWFEVTPHMFKTPVPVTVKVNILDPEDDIRKKNSLSQELAAGTIDQLSAIEEAHPDKDARLLQRRITVDRLMNHPIIQQVVAGGTAEKLMQSLELQDILADALQRIQGQEEAEGVSAQRATPPAEADGGVVSGSRQDSGLRRAAEGRLG
jgi:hypothetical protein